MPLVFPNSISFIVKNEFCLISSEVVQKGHNYLHDKKIASEVNVQLQKVQVRYVNIELGLWMTKKAMNPAIFILHNYLCFGKSGVI